MKLHIGKKMESKLSLTYIMPPLNLCEHEGWCTKRCIQCDDRIGTATGPWAFLKDDNIEKDVFNIQ